MPRRLLITGAVFAALLLAGGAACGGDEEGPVDGSGEPTATEAVDIDELLGESPADPAEGVVPAGYTASLPGVPPEAAATEAKEPEGGALERLYYSAGMTGSVVPGVGLCEQNRILMTSPNMTASVQSYSRGNVVTIGGAQWVAFRAHLARWDGAQWATVADQPWKWQSVALQGGDVTGDWYNGATGAYGSAVEPFPITQDGYYAVFLEYYWFANEYVTDGYLKGWGSVQEYRYGDYNVQMMNYCQYPP